MPGLLVAIPVESFCLKGSALQRHPSGALLGEDTLQRPSPLESLQRCACVLAWGQIKLHEMIACLALGPETDVRYKSLVNQIHPERCVDARAKEAFARSSAAFVVASPASRGLGPWEL